MGAWGAVLRTGDRQRRSLEINLGPLQITQLAGPEAVAEGNEDHGLVPMGPAVAFAPLDQPLDLGLGEVLAGADIGVLGSARCDFPYFSGRPCNFQGWIRHWFQCSVAMTFG